MKDKLIKIYKSKIFKNSLWLTVLQIMNTVIPMLTIPYITRVLGVEKYGVFSIALNWILYFQVFVEFGFGLTGARKTAIIDNKNDLNKLFNNIISSRILLFVISFICLNIIAIIMEFNIQTYICMSLLSIMIFGTTFQLTWLFQGKQDMKFITIINSISRIISVVLIFLLVKSENDLYLYCVLYSITLLLSSIIGMFVAYNKYELKFRFAKFKNIFEEINEGKYLFFSSAMSKIFSGIGITILSIISTSYLVGIYSAITKIPYILTMFFSPISQALFPYNSIKLNENMDDGIRFIKKTCLPVFISFAIITIFIIVFRNLIVNILFGKEYSKYSLIVIPLAIQFLFGMINNFIGVQFMVASNNQKAYSESFTVGCVVILLSNIILGKLIGIYGVAFASLIAEIFLTIILFIKAKKLYERKN